MESAHVLTLGLFVGTAFVTGVLAVGILLRAASYDASPRVPRRSGSSVRRGIRP